jgi:hypothetical protein
MTFKALTILLAICATGSCSKNSGQNVGLATNGGNPQAAISRELVELVARKIEKDYKMSGMAGLSYETELCYENNKSEKYESISECILMDRVSYQIDLSFRQAFYSQQSRDLGPTVPYFSDDLYLARRTLSAKVGFKGSVSAEDAFYAKAVSAILDTDSP